MYIVMAYVLMAYIVMTYVLTAYIVMAYVLMAYIVMAYILMACSKPSPSQCPRKKMSCVPETSAYPR